MYEKLLKSIFYLWGFVFLIFGSKIILNHVDVLTELSKKTWNQVSDIDIGFDFTPSETMTLVLMKKYGMTISGVSMCKDTYKSGRVQSKINPLLSNVSSSCWNGECKILLAFKDEIPEKIKLNIKTAHSDNCQKKTYVVGENKNLVGYQIKTVLSPEIKEKLGLSTGNEEIRFKHDIGFTRSKVNGGDEMTFDFPTQLKSDMLMVDGQEKFRVMFELK